MNLKFHLVSLAQVLIILFSSPLLASPLDIRFSMLAGLGESQTSSADSSGKSKTERPGAVGFALEQNVYGPYYLFAEHMRSIGEGGTSVGLTGIGFKFFPWLTPMENRPINFNHPKTQIETRGLSPFIGFSFGFAQSSILGDRNSALIAAVTGYLSIKAGFEYSVSDNWGLAAEINFANTVTGSGTVTAYNSICGPYISF